jgi:hypothetical protein
MNNTANPSATRKPRMRLVTYSDHKAEPVGTVAASTITTLFVLDMPWKLESFGFTPEPGQPTHMLPVFKNEADAIAMQTTLKSIGKHAEIRVARFVK